MTADPRIEQIRAVLALPATQLVDHWDNYTELYEWADHQRSRRIRAILDRPPTAPGSDKPVRDEVVGAWCLLEPHEREEVDDVAPDLARVLERLTGDANREAFEREVGPGMAAPC